MLSRGIAPGGFEREKLDAGGKEKPRRQAANISLVSPLNKDPDSKYEACIYRQRYSDRLCVVDLLQAQHEGLVFFQTVNGSVFCYDTIPPKFLESVIVLKDESLSYSRTNQRSQTLQ